MKVLLIDHHDSFSYNIVRLMEECGAEVEVFSYGPGLLEKAGSFGKILLSPGPGLPLDYPLTLELLDREDEQRDFFGVCLGLQCLAHHCGASLFNQPRVRHGETVRIINHRLAGSALGSLDKVFEGVLYHSWAVDMSTVGHGLCITAVSSEGIIMGLRHKTRMIEAVQFHPESFRCPSGKEIISNWLKK